MFVTWFLLGRERTLGMIVCVWRPLLFSAVVIIGTPSSRSIAVALHKLYKGFVSGIWRLLFRALK